MPVLDDLGDFLSPTLDLPVAGKVYRVPSPPARVGLRLQAAHAVMAAGRAGATPRPSDLAIAATDDGSTSLEQDTLGPVYQQMLDDDVPVEAVKRAATTAYLWIVIGEEAATRYWRTPLGEARAPETPALPSTPGAAEPKTRSRASTSGTRSRRTS